jgi:hypothetical protein
MSLDQVASHSLRGRAPLNFDVRRKMNRRSSDFKTRYDVIRVRVTVVPQLAIAIWEVPTQ